MLPKTSNEPFLDYILNLVLRIGLFFSLALILCGGFLFFLKNGSEIVDYRFFDGEPANYRNLKEIIKASFTMDPFAIILSGIVVLIATPVLRVISCLIIFIAERDTIYIIVSLAVLCILLYALNP
jgi:uncharacterized membrane protein